MAAKYCIFAALLFAIAAAEDFVIIDGNCPDVTAVQNFDVAAFSGKWWEISRYPLGARVTGNCGSAEYTLNGDVFKVKNSRVVNGAENSIEGTAKLAENANGAGKMEVTFNLGPVTRTSSEWILATNYKDYALLYSCRFDSAQNKSKLFVFVLSKSKTLKGDSKTAIDAALKAANLDATKLVQADLSEEACKITNTVDITKPTA